MFKKANVIESQLECLLFLKHVFSQIHNVGHSIGYLTRFFQEVNGPEQTELGKDYSRLRVKTGIRI